MVCGGRTDKADNKWDWNHVLETAAMGKLKTSAISGSTGLYTATSRASSHDWRGCVCVPGLFNETSHTHTHNSLSDTSPSLSRL